ncbi:hypothetical protein Efla_004554 [Eimeria flavescens]
MPSTLPGSWGNGRGLSTSGLLRRPEKTIRQERGGPHSPTLQWEASLLDEAFRLHEVGPARLESIQAKGVCSEETWHQGRPLDDSPYGVAPPPQTPHVRAHWGEREIDLRRKQAESACADGGLMARETCCPDCPPEATVDPHGSAQRERLPGAPGTEGWIESWGAEFDRGRGRLKSLIGSLPSVSSSHGCSLVSLREPVSA